MDTTLELNQRPILSDEIKGFNPFALTFRYVLAAFATSQLGAAAMAWYMLMILKLFENRNGLYFFQVIGSVVFGKEALTSFHMSALILGIFLHFGILAMVWGVIYGVAAANWRVCTFKKSLALGLGLGVLSMIVDSYMLAPPILSSLYGTDVWNQNIPKFSDWIAHLIFGGTFILFPLALRFSLDERFIPKRKTYP